MTTMLEKAARALFDSYVRLSGMNADEAEPYWLAQQEGFVSSARAALQAIREPSKTIVEAGNREHDAQCWNDGTCPDKVFAAMIDAILNEKA